MFSQNKRHRLTSEEFVGFFEAAEERPSKPGSIDEVRNLIKEKNSYRWWRIQHDFKWLQKQMKKMGYNPDDARELL